jgi:hypothetical protein
MAEGAERDAETYALLSILLAVLAVGLFVAGVDLLVTCEASMGTLPFGGTTVTCSFPFQGYGVLFLYAGSLVAVASSASLTQFRMLRGHKYDWDRRALFGGAVAGLTVFFLLALLTFGFI